MNVAPLVSSQKLLVGADTFVTIPLAPKCVPCGTTGHRKAPLLQGLHVKAAGLMVSRKLQHRTLRHVQIRDGFLTGGARSTRISL